MKQHVSSVILFKVLCLVSTANALPDPRARPDADPWGHGIGFGNYHTGGLINGGYGLGYSSGYGPHTGIVGPVIPGPGFGFGFGNGIGGFGFGSGRWKRDASLEPEASPQHAASPEPAALHVPVPEPGPIDSPDSAAASSALVPVIPEAAASPTSDDSSNRRQYSVHSQGYDDGYRNDLGGYRYHPSYAYRDDYRNGAYYGDGYRYEDVIYGDEYRNGDGYRYSSGYRIPTRGYDSNYRGLYGRYVK